MKKDRFGLGKLFGMSLMIILMIAIMFSVNVFASSEIETTGEDLVVGVYNYNSALCRSNGRYYLGDCEDGVRYYKIYRYDDDLYAILNLDLSQPYYKGSTAMTVTQTMGKTYTSQSGFDFSVSVGGEANFKLFKVSASVTGGMSYTTGVSFDITNSVSYQIERNDRTGYYKIGVCHDIYNNVAEEYYMNENVQSIYIPTSKGVPYFALLYSTASDSGYERN